MKNFRQEIYTEITGTHEGWTFHSKLLRNYIEKKEEDKIIFIQEVGKMIRKRDDKYVKGHTPYRYLITPIEAKRIYNAIENKEKFIKATACYESLADHKEWE